MTAEPNRRETLRRAKAGDFDAQYSLAIDYATGERGVRKNLDRARHWYRLIACRGEGKATHDFAMMVWFGEGGPADAAEAMRLMRKAAHEGSSDADIWLGYRALESKPQRAADVGRAAAHFAQAALRKDPRGFLELVDLAATHGDRFRAAIEAGVRRATRRSNEPSWRDEFGLRIRS